MFKSTLLTVALVGTLLNFVKAGAIVDPNNLPHQSEEGQSGYNDCGTVDSASSVKLPGYTASTIGVRAFSSHPPSLKLIGVATGMFAPQSKGKTIGDVEETVVAWCTKPGHGARLIPAGTLKGCHWLQTKSFLQITCTGDFTKVNVLKGDEGGELDPHGPSGKGNPIGGLVIGSLKGKKVQYAEWHEFIDYNTLSIRVCIPGTGREKAYCPHIYDEMGSEWNDPGNYDVGYFDKCQGSDPLTPGVYGTSTFHQGDKTTPAAHPTTKTYSCTTTTSIAGSAYPKKREYRIDPSPFAEE
ncbi:hypothetical protein BT69DRAFT_1339278 [Atractiella rhizophila]|nr:hypothetical protein BT69DRAFT_1339278 [Atractiella rhizophila]